MKKLIFICNPHSGRGVIRERLPEILDFYNRKGFLPSVYFTRKDDDLSDALSLADEDTYIVCSGGDGMINILANAMLVSGIIRPFGYIPSGTTNDFAKSAGIPTELGEALEVSVSENIIELDAGALAGTLCADTGKVEADKAGSGPEEAGGSNKYFMYVAGFGLFTDVSYKTPQSTKNAFGYLAYLLEGARSIAELKTLRLKVSVDGKAIEGDLKDTGEGEYLLGLVTNSMSVAGMRTIGSGETKLDDGLFEMLLIKKVSNLSELSALVSAAMAGDMDSDRIVYRQGREFTFEVCHDGDARAGLACDKCDKPPKERHPSNEKETAEQGGIAWTLDGEYGGSYEKSTVRAAGKMLLRGR